MELSRNFVDYTSQDLKSILRDIENSRDILMPEYTDKSDTDFGNFLLKYMAMMADVLSWKIDYSINEAFAATAVTMRSMYKHCKWKGYRPRSNRAATTVFEITIMNNGEVTHLSKGFKVTMESKIDGDYLKYELDEDLVFNPADYPDSKIGDMMKFKVRGTQGETVSETIGYATTDEDQEYYIQLSPYIEGSISVEAYDPETLRSVFFKENENKSFVGTSPTDRVIVLEAVDMNLIKIKFGDGINGAIPDTDCQLIAHYRIGGGAIGNRPVGVINTFLDDAPFNVMSVINIEEASGGVDAETVAEIKKAIEKNRDKIIYSLMQRTDYENFLANRSDVIERFLVCQDRKDPIRLHRPIAIHIKPWRKQFFDAEYKNALLQEMKRICLVDEEINIYDCVFTKFFIHVNVMADPLYVMAGIESSIKYAINDFINHLSIGTRERDGLTYLYVDDVRNVVRQVEGVSRFIATAEFCNKADKGKGISEDRVLEWGEVIYLEDVEKDVVVEFV